MSLGAFLIEDDSWHLQWAFSRACAEHGTLMNLALRKYEFTAFDFGKTQSKYHLVKTDILMSVLKDP
jgi:hypothetical protein